ncbi:(deoxy)nucleoside triphosphate pyrophosphohydrolase [Gelidibacter japonicus]|uniref:(deoxy)nucleoside triphosphate pyrophosphohydrolase n=1 Tax=Gelidibacter japonicus TaxID=1962232 RepID=UPI002022002A|nr:(deoxy)nucleoside triphosphate pyrophosphohydrolase [Gelidibacter japonicus]MCL8007902.1 (deoxy)nucleoside triphosphate pyrophosphohydrolase [Gelidibacter japonicus]
MKTIPVTCAIIYFENKILAVQRSETMKLPLKWEFPGGKIEKGESEIDCVKREVLEELNIHIEVKQRLTPVTHAYPDFKIELIPFTADYLSGELKLKEHADYVLLEKEELYTLDWAEADIPIVEEL